ncbi:hypothetical protein [Clostridium gallinarum]|nr:hypothetical protein [Clostridium gallinarum]
MRSIGRKTKRKRLSLSILMIFVVSIFYGCKNKEEKYIKVDLNSGAIAIEKSGEYNVYNFSNGIYEKVELGYVITSFDSQSGNFIFNQNGEFKVNYLGEEFLINENDNDNIYSAKLSRGGNYLSYFVKNGYLDLKIKDLAENKNIDINSNVYISGELLDWLDKDTLVYYGVDKNKNNGLFIYNIKEGTEELLYKLDSGYVEYLKVLDNGLVFLQEKEGKQKYLKFINETGEVSYSLNNIVEAIDIEETSNGVFVLGKVENNNYSLYELKDGKIKRLVYDFPKIINLEKGLSKDSEGNILFVGGEDIDNQKIYICIDEAISSIDVEDGNYYFIEYN